MKHSLQALLEGAAATLAGGLLPEAPAPGTVLVERTRDAQHGDFTSNAALRLAKTAGKPAGVTPLELAQAIVAALPPSALIARAEVASPGFINVFLAPAAYAEELARIHAEGRRYGRSTFSPGDPRAQRVRVAYLTAAAAGPLDAGHGRQVVHSDSLANLLAAAGYEVVRECYITDCAGPEDRPAVRAQALADLREALQLLGVGFDRGFSQAALARGSPCNRALARVAGTLPLDPVNDSDTSDSDTAEGGSRLIGILGPGHSKKAAHTSGDAVDGLEIQQVQSLSLLRGQDKLPMLSVRQLRKSVDRDACRFFYLMRSHEEPLNFDLELAQARNTTNPVYEVQYAHARVASALNELRARGLRYDPAAGLAHVALLTTKQEAALLACLTRYPEVLQDAALLRAPHQLARYLRELAHALHTYHHQDRWVVPEEPLRHARLALVLGVQQVIRSGLELLGLSAPDSM